MYVEVPNVLRQSGGHFVLRNLLGTSQKVEKSLKGGVLTPVMYLSPERALFRMVFFEEAGSEFMEEGSSLGRRLVSAVSNATGVPFTLLMERVRSFNSCEYACTCKFVCLAQYAGRLQYRDLHIFEALKTLLFIADREAFYENLVIEILALKAKVDRGFTKDGVSYAPGELDLWVRLNGGSDLDWYSNHFSPIRYMERNDPEVKFFDYTKDYYRMVEYLNCIETEFPLNYELTWSAGSVDRWTAAVMGMNAGVSPNIDHGNVAVIFREFPAIHDDPYLDLIGEFGYTLIDGTVSDARGLDEARSIVCLKPLGRPARKNTTSKFMFNNLADFVQRITRVRKVSEALL